MRGPWRLVPLVAVLNVIAGGVAGAQTVIVRNAPPGSPVEVVRNETSVASGTAGPSGDAVVEVKFFPDATKTEMDILVFVDVCEKVRRVIIVERAMQPQAQEAGCTRREMGGLFVLRPVSSLVVDTAGASPTLMLRQGRVSLAPPRTWGDAPTGLVFFGGGGLSKFSDAAAVACGAVSPCSDGGHVTTFAVGGAFWLNRFLAAEGSYMKPGKLEITGSGTDFRFNSEVDAFLVNVVGKVGVPVGPVRFYGQVGTNYVEAETQTTQTNDDSTVTIDGVEQVIKGGTQAYELKTKGWSWIWGGGFETWVTRSFAFYGELGFANLKGSAYENVEDQFEFSDRLTYYIFGARIRIGR